MNHAIWCQIFAARCSQKCHNHAIESCHAPLRVVSYKTNGVSVEAMDMQGRQTRWTTRLVRRDAREAMRPPPGATPPAGVAPVLADRTGSG